MSSSFDHGGLSCGSLIGDQFFLFNVFIVFVNGIQHRMKPFMLLFRTSKQYMSTFSQLQIPQLCTPKANHIFNLEKCMFCVSRLIVCFLNSNQFTITLDDQLMPSIVTTLILTWLNSISHKSQIEC